MTENNIKDLINKCKSGEIEGEKTGLDRYGIEITYCSFIIPEKNIGDKCKYLHNRKVNIVDEASDSGETSDSLKYRHVCLKSFIRNYNITKSRGGK